MKKNFAYLAAFGLTGLVVLSGCSLSGDNQKSKEYVAPTADTILDDELFSDAIQGRSLLKCNMIADATKKSECTVVIESFKFTYEALAGGDVKLCKKIELPRYRELCELEVKANENAAIDSEKEEARVQGEADKVSELIQKGDLEGCKTLADANFRGMCEANIKATQK